MHALRPGARVGAYEIVRVLGAGGFGITYCARNTVLRRRASVALKEFFPTGFAARDGQSQVVYSTREQETIAWALQKFEETTTALADLEHPNIVQVYEYLPANNTAYMAMEMLEGVSLKGWLSERAHPPSLDALRPLLDPVLDALTYLHGQGLIHRDIAPDNIMLEAGTTRPVLIDFGAVSRDLSRRLGEPTPQEQAYAKLTRMTVGIEKPGYTAPDQASARARPNPTADVYSIAAVLYRALTGEPPPPAQERNDRYHGDPYRALSASPPPGCSPTAAAVIDAALSPRPEQRPESIAALRALLGWGAASWPGRADEPATLVPVSIAPLSPVPGLHALRDETRAEVSAPPDPAAQAQPPPDLPDLAQGRGPTPAVPVWPGAAAEKPRPARRLTPALAGAAALVAVIGGAYLIGSQSGPRQSERVAVLDQPARQAREAEQRQQGVRDQEEADREAARRRLAQEEAEAAQRAQAAAQAREEDARAAQQAQVARVAQEVREREERERVAAAETARQRQAEEQTRQQRARELAEVERRRQEEQARVAALVSACDRVAAHPNDRDKPSTVPGVEFGRLDTQAAIMACEAALSAVPNERRIAFQLGRALDKAAQHDRARALYERAAAAGSAAAMTRLGALYEAGRGVTQDYAQGRAWYERAAEAGSAEAMNSLGVLSYQGHGAPRDYVRARRWYEQAAVAGSAAAMYNLGFLYEDESSAVVSPDRALHWYQRAAASGEARAGAESRRLEAALACDRQAASPTDPDRNKGVPPVERVKLDAEAAVTVCRAAVERAGTAPPRRLLFQIGRALDVLQAFGEARSWYERAAGQGSAAAMFNLGVLHETGRGGPVSRERALEWYRKAAAAGDGHAGAEVRRLEQAPTEEQVRQEQARVTALVLACDRAAGDLGDRDQPSDVPGVHISRLDALTAISVCEAALAAAPNERRTAFQLGRALEKRGQLERARDLYRRAADQGSAAAMTNLGVMYADGLGITRDDVEALRWFRRAAEAGNQLGMIKLAWMYQNRPAVGRNDAEVVRWYRRAAETGYTLGMVNLGILYRDGTGLQKSNSEALRWFRQAAEFGDPLGMTNMGFMYETGLGVSKDGTEALRWYTKASDHGDEFAKAAVQRLQQGARAP